MNLDQTQEELFKATGDVADWCEEQYSKLFAPYFSDTSEMYKTLNSQERSKLTDSEIEYILTTLPLNMIGVSEQLSQYKLNRECLKVHIKKKRSEIVVNSAEKTVTAKREQAELETLDYEILDKAYAAVISRVENEMNFSRELIMSAKKIWDARVKTYDANPINSAPDGELSSYDSFPNMKG